MSKLRGEKIVGNAGENATVLKLSMLGYAASTVKQDGVDIAVVGGAGLKVAQRVEVKTVLQSDDMRKYNFTISRGVDKRCYTRNDCDIIALVVLDIPASDAVLFFPVESFMSVKSLSLTQNDFYNPSEKHHWKEVLDYSQDMMAEVLKMQKLRREYKVYEKV
jgi:tetrahydromethanopterin S-methyltransferase subunit H